MSLSSSSLSLLLLLLLRLLSIINVPNTVLHYIPHTLNLNSLHLYQYACLENELGFLLRFSVSVCRDILLYDMCPFFQSRVIRVQKLGAWFAKARGAFNPMSPICRVKIGWREFFNPMSPICRPKSGWREIFNPMSPICRVKIGWRDFFNPSSPICRAKIGWRGSISTKRTTAFAKARSTVRKSSESTVRKSSTERPSFERCTIALKYEIVPDSMRGTDGLCLYCIQHRSKGQTISFQSLYNAFKIFDSKILD